MSCSVNQFLIIVQFFYLQSLLTYKHLLLFYNKVLDIDKIHGPLYSVAHFLESRGMIEEALEVSTDPDYRFELAIQLGKLEIAKVI